MAAKSSPSAASSGPQTDRHKQAIPPSSQCRTESLRKVACSAGVGDTALATVFRLFCGLFGLIVLWSVDHAADIPDGTDQLLELAGPLLHDGRLHGRLDACLRQLLRQLLAGQRLQPRAATHSFQQIYDIRHDVLLLSPKLLLKYKRCPMQLGL
jgi:hypothetical protein